MTTLTPENLNMNWRPKGCTIGDCCAASIKAFGVGKSEFFSDRRHQYLARARFAAMWMARAKTRRSFPEIGRAMGGRDHTTVISGVRRAEELFKTDVEFAHCLQMAWINLHGGLPGKGAEG